ncbi:MULTISPECIES: anti sigma factor C-terminal domain-containing protein [Cytobacillus]|uniref:Sigma factor regulator C-terminal domain-containing protein n=1 Tax=Cytobacillus oceanisediminis TaxID=665099 RepID=A0ABX3CMH8_9BACI|nr:anti sigma factor C-terminal domain-containing protein [Cytobacillus oceanisediminis]EFV75058.1 hypothetical protein HMPREF1013_04703 [Bacillus sp. 2_A_57_CT2]MCM3403009.1 anti-sigma factor C-terminal domain-containing protein [Cytobacillus oceanisediminis]OHX44604.1 hypothetical protein BBV17_25615 [Cytobacillus oceanisediminis]
MSDKNPRGKAHESSDQNESFEEIDFTSSPSVQKVFTKTRRKQTFKYVFIAFLTTAIVITAIIFGSQAILNNKIEKHQQNLLKETVYGANVHSSESYYIHGMFSVTEETKYRKQLGDRYIIWNKKLQRIPLFGSIKTVSQGSGMTGINRMDKEAKRTVRYNDFNNEREIEFYYPDVSYSPIPKELDIALGLDNDKLIEVAVSFKHPMTLDQLSKQLGYKNVNWLWVDTTSQSKKEEINKIEVASAKTKWGEDAFGFDVSGDLPYTTETGQVFISNMKELSNSNSTIKKALKTIRENTKNSNGELLISGAVVTGTPEELERFKELKFIRATVLGATIDRY